MGAETTINETHQTQVASAKADPWTGATLHLIKAAEGVGSIPIPTIERNDADS